MYHAAGSGYARRIDHLKVLGRRFDSARVHMKEDWEKRARKSGDLRLLTKIVIKDAKRSDRAHGTGTQLTEPFVAAVISAPCTYCGETELRMTLDRIDNAQGHSQANVVGACIRCNYVRRNMPHAAWLLLVPGLRSAREAGAFGKWTGAIH